MNIFMNRIPGQAVDTNIKEASDSHDRFFFVFFFSLEQPFRGLLVNPFTAIPASVLLRKRQKNKNKNKMPNLN